MRLPGKEAEYDLSYTQVICLSYNQGKSQGGEERKKPTPRAF